LGQIDDGALIEEHLEGVYFHLTEDGMFLMQHNMRYIDELFSFILELLLEFKEPIFDFFLYVGVKFFFGADQLRLCYLLLPVCIWHPSCL